MNMNWKPIIYTALLFSIITGYAPAVEEGPFFLDEPRGTIPVIYSHGGGPCDIGGMVFLTRHPKVDLIGMVLSRGEIHPEIAVDGQFHSNWQTDTGQASMQLAQSRHS